MKNIFITILILTTFTGFTQVKKDTLYIYFDSIQPTMNKGVAKMRVFDENRKIVEYLIISYWIDEIIRPNPEMLDTGYTFQYNERTPYEVRIMGGPEGSKSILKDLNFLNTINPLDHTFFETTEYIKVCKTFEAEDSREQDVIIFVIDKDEIKDGKIILREVFFSRPAKE
jgi:hypothetical protein